MDRAIAFAGPSPRCAILRPSMSSSDDFELLRRWREGDREAANALMGRYYVGIHRFFTLRAPQAAEDLTQQSLLACVEGHATIRDGASFRSYLFGIAWHKLLDHLREADRHARLISAQAAHVPTVELTPSGVVARREEQGLLLRALATLPSDIQSTLVLFYWEGMSTAEIGDVLEVSVSAVTSRLSRARERLREAASQLVAPPTLRASLVDDLDRWARSLVDGDRPS